MFFHLLGKVAEAAEGAARIMITEVLRHFLMSHQD